MSRDHSCATFQLLYNSSKKKTNGKFFDRRTVGTLLLAQQHRSQCEPRDTVKSHISLGLVRNTIFR